MNMPYTRAPHRGDSVSAAIHGDAPNAALLIDFDNVTMGMRSDLSRDLKKLLESDVIRGKVTVQRAYADWRRYPQYIVPLSENSIDLIFAPAYGSSKKNATDIRMAIDAVELVFVRPEIGTFILLTGDSDFSSCVLKLKEYGKYVIGVGIEESSSDILVQNCDEYYSYTSLTGLTKTTDGDQTQSDPWVLVEQAIKRMADRGDVMRSDRLKQVMIELDGGFDEGKFGFSKFSRFITEAASRGLLTIRKLENGQYEVAPGEGKGNGSRRKSRDDSRSRRSRRDRDDRRESRRGRGDGARDGSTEVDTEAGGDEPAAAAAAPVDDDATTTDGSASIEAAYDLTRRALEVLRDAGRAEVRDSDVKRKMLELDRSFDEAELGFGKFSRFLRQAHNDEAIDLQREDGGNYLVSLPSGTRPAAPRRDAKATATEADGGVSTAAADEAAAASPAASTSAEPIVRELRPEDVIDPDAPGRRLGPRGGTTRRRDDAPPPFLPGQTASSAPASTAAESAAETAAPPAPAPEGASAPAEAAATVDDGSVATADLGLPTGAAAQIRYLSNSYRGVGRKTAEALVEEFGDELFDVLRTDPTRIQSVVPAGRADALLDAWNEDLSRRLAQATGQATGQTPADDNEAGSGGSSGGRRGGRRGRGGRGRS
jgi:uncharacterized protein (TIGR00288 family)